MTTSHGLLLSFAALLAVILLHSTSTTTAFRQQAIAVKGRLRCGEAPARSVRVKLFDEDDGPDPDDLLDQGYTDSNGEFKLEGSTMETTNIDPVFKVYHDCNDGIKPGSRKVKFRLPSKYITNGTVAKQVFDIGEINLETIFAEEERELIVSKRLKRARRGSWEDFDLFSHF